MIFHLPGNDPSSIGSNADTPFSSCWLKPGLTPTTLNGAIFWPTVFMEVFLQWYGDKTQVMGACLIIQSNYNYEILNRALSGSPLLRCRLPLPRAWAYIDDADRRR